MVDPEPLSQQALSQKPAPQQPLTREPISRDPLARDSLSQQTRPEQPLTREPPSIEEMVQAARMSVEEGTDIRSRVRDLTLHAVRDHRFQPDAIRDVLRAMTEGIRRGAEQRPHGVRQALADALKGLDEAMMKSAEAASLALRELTTQGKEFSDHELKQVLDNVKKMEEDFLHTTRQAADRASVIVRRDMLDALSHLQRTGTDTGAKVASTLSEFGSRVTTLSLEGAKVTFETAREFGARFALVASGILSGLAEALSQPSNKNTK
jgi:hypothetical protein